MSNLNDFIVKVFTPDNIMILLVIFLFILAIIVACLIAASVRENKNILKDDKLKIENNTIEEDLIKKIEPKQNIEKIVKYEKEQEQKAIISYDELLKGASKLQVDYEEDEQIADIIIQKVAVKEKEEPTINNYKTNDNSSYNEEETFLKTLKEFRADL